MILSIVISVVVGLAINEYADFAPWGARKLAGRAARRMYADNAERAKIRAEEWAAVIDDRPGKLFKLASALCYSIAAEFVVVHRRARSASSVRRTLLRFAFDAFMMPRVLGITIIEHIGRWKGLILFVLILYWPTVPVLLIVPFIEANSSGANGAHTLFQVISSVALSVPLATLYSAFYMRAMARLVMRFAGEGDERWRKESVAAAINGLRPGWLKQ